MDRYLSRRWVLRLHLAHESVPGMDLKTRSELERETDLERRMQHWMQRWMGRHLAHFPLDSMGV